MDYDTFVSLWETHENESHNFDVVQPKFSVRRDLHAYILLDKILPGRGPIVCAAEHDEIWLDIDCAELAKVITEEQIIEIIRCGIFFDAEVESLHRYT